MDIITQRSDYSVEYGATPRQVTINDPSTDFVAQDIIDTLAAEQANIDALDDPQLLVNSGGEELEAGLSVGLTVALQDTQIGFEMPPSAVVVGTVTTTDTTARYLYDSVANFALATPGDAIVHITSTSQISWATVSKIISANQIETTTQRLAGAASAFTVGDNYCIIPTKQCDVGGGNVIAIDDIGDPIASVFPTAFTQVVLAKSSSATQVGGSITNESIADAVWDEILTGVTHNIQNSAGKRLRDIASQAIHTDTAQGPAANGNQIQLALAASSVDGSYDPSMITIIDGTGAGQTRVIYQYEGSTRTATVDRNWKVNPDATSEYIIFSHPGREHVNEGLAQGGTSNTITLNALASTINDVYNYQTVFLRSGTGEDQTGLITAYNGTTKVATIDRTWDITPDGTTGYVMLPTFNNPVATNFSSFQNVVTIDVANGSAGTLYPIGTHIEPSNNLADAITIGAVYGITEFHIFGTLTIGASENVDGYTFTGVNPLTSVIILTAGCSTDRTNFFSMIVAGTLNGPVYMETVGIQTVSNIGSDTFPTIFNECIFRAGTNTFRTGLTTPQNIHFIECVSGVPGSGTAILDINGTDSPLSFRKFGGGIKILNYTGGQNSSFEFHQGHMIIDVTCNNGIIQLGGIYKLTNNGTLTVTERNESIGTAVATVDISQWETVGTTLAETLNMLRAVGFSKMIVDDVASPSEVVFYKEDGTSFYFKNIVKQKGGSLDVVLSGTGPAVRNVRTDTP